MKMIFATIAAASMLSANLAVAQAQKAAPNPQASCIQAIQKDNAAFAKAFADGVKSGKIDPKEKAALEKTHADLIAAEKAAAADKNVSAAECKALHDKVVAQHKQFTAAMAASGKPAAPPAPGAKPVVHPQASCVHAIQKDNAAFAKAFANGVKSGKIDPKEKAALEKTHADLIAAEKAAAADKNVSAAECKALHDKVVAQHKQFTAAMAAPAAAKKP